MTNIQMEKKNVLNQVSKMCIPQILTRTDLCLAEIRGDINQKQKAREGKTLRDFAFIYSC